MKKHTRLLSLLLAFSLMFCGVFATNAFASDGVNGETNSNATTKAASAWTPTADYEGIAYGVWASEADYLAGKAPTKWYSDTTLLTDNIGTTDTDGTNFADPNFIPGFVRIFKDVEMTKQIVTGDTQVLVIDFGGNAVTAKSQGGFRIGGKSASHPKASLTIKNGTYLFMSGQIQARPDTTFICESITMTISLKQNSHILYGCCADLVRFTNCTITSKEGNIFGFSTNYANKGTERSKFIFENTQMTFQQSPTLPLFNVPESAYGDAQYDFVFDKNSSITGLESTFIQLKESADSTFTKKQTVTFEDGFKLNGAPSALTQYEYVDSMGIASMKIANDERIHMNTAPEVEPEEPDTPDTPDLPGDVDFPIIAYDKNGSEVKKWTNAVIEEGTLDYLPDGATIKLFADASASVFHTPSHNSLTIDLNGHKLTFTKTGKNELGKGMSGTWSNNRTINIISSTGHGVLDAAKKTSELFQARPGTTVLFENVDIIASSYIFSDGGLNSVTFRNCKITGMNSSRPICNTDGLGAGVTGRTRTYTFDNTTIEGYSIILTSAMAADDTIVINVLNGSKLNSTKPMLQIFPNTYREENMGASGVRDITFNIEAGSRFTTNTYTEAEFTIVKNGVTYTTDNAIITFNYYSEGEGEEFGDKLSLDRAVLFPCTDGYMVGEFGVVDTSDYSYTVSLPGQISVMYPNKTSADGKAILTCEDIKKIPEGATIYFHRDLTYDSTGSSSSDGRLSGYKNGITYDLNGFTFIFSGYRFQFEKSFTFRNGTVDCNGTTTIPFMGNPGAGKVAAFLNVDLVIDKPGSGVYSIFNPYSGAVSFIGGSIKASTSQTVFSFTNTTYHALTLENTEVTAGALISTAYVAGISDEYSIKSTTLNLSDSVLTITGNCTSASNTIKLNITDSKVSAVALVKADAVNANLAEVTVSESYFTAEPVVSSVCGTLAFANKNKLILIDDEIYGFRVTGVRVDLKANLLLESDFTVQFLVPEGSNIISVEIGGVVYTVSEVSDTLLYDGTTFKLIAVSGILPGEAADAIELKIVYTEDGVTHTANATYSVLNYVNTLLNTDYSRYIKAMAVAAVEYIAETYDYLGKAEPAALTALMESSNYKANVPESVAAVGGSTDFGNASTVLEKANLDLGATMKLRFTIKAGYTGTLTVGDAQYTVNNGMVGDVNYIELELAAHELFDKVIEVKADGVSGTYCLAEYAAYIATSSESLDDKALVSAFYTYCAYADAYADVAMN